ncbi:MAG: DUF4097 family beta strand repeat-containing protein [bacterium]
MKKAFFIFMIAAAALSAAARSDVNDYKRFSITDRRKLEWTEGGALSLTEIAGEIYVRPGDKNFIQLNGIKTAFGDTLDMAREEAKKIEISIAAPADRIDVTTKLGRRKNGLPFGLIDYDARMPADAQAQLKTVSGEINAARLNGPVSAETFTGPVNLYDIKGRVEVITISGDIDIEDCPETASAVSRAGRIYFEAVKLTSKEVLLESMSGDVTVKLQEGESAEFEVDTVSGLIDTSGAKLKTLEDAVGIKRFKAGEGGATIRIKTVSGKVSIIQFPKVKEYR